MCAECWLPGPPARRNGAETLIAFWVGSGEPEISTTVKKRKRGRAASMGREIRVEHM
jgi:hypothetical protein